MRWKMDVRRGSVCVGELEGRRRERMRCFEGGTGGSCGEVGRVRGWSVI